MKQAGAKLCLSGIILLAVALFSCDMPVGGYEYAFDNQTLYPIKITILDRGFKNSKDGDEQRGSFLVFSQSKHTIYVESTSVEFEWTADELRYNREIFADKSGSKITFRKRY
ncbi:MAG: hypothetical protein LBD48_10315 [Treponema sp.]|jgi:hypothetical protein|nr:hypothetical protein [Treponema sp.]